MKKVITLFLNDRKNFFGIIKKRLRDLFLIYSYKFLTVFYNSTKLKKFFSLKLSKNKKKVLEITPQIGCTMMCSYCPQTLIVSEARERNAKKIMEIENFEKMIKNIPSDTWISWAGYTEPLLHSYFIDFVKLLNEKGYTQTINTTMHGKKESQEFMSNTNLFKSVGFHLPDNEGLMKLSVKDSYLFYLEKAIRHQSSILDENSIHIKIIGDKPHKKIEHLLKKLIDEKIIKENIITSSKIISSRNNFMSQEDKKYKFFSLFKNIKKKKLYYCSYTRLNSGVLLPNGDVNICCNDYSLGFSIGNLLEQNLDQMKNHEKLMTQTNFLNGDMKVCNKCEYYKSI
jgi:radical SAM protein with 4Fe4S-binding SPASM domain|tara:strand:- start:523 stop:1545 length:1023 start_codon:yes stop_codon:yes gene_type:complete